MSNTKRTRATGPAHWPLSLFGLDGDGLMLDRAITDMEALRALVDRSADECQAVAATALRCVGEDEGKRVQWHFATLRDRLAAQLHRLEDFIEAKTIDRPSVDVIHSLLATVQADLDHYRRVRTAPIRGIWTIKP